MISPIKFDNEELNCLNVCLDHFIEEQTDAFLFDFYPSFPFKKKDFHQGIGSDQLEMYSEQLKRLSMAVRALGKIKKMGGKDV